MARMVDDGGGYTGQLGDRNAVALAGRAGLDVVQENNVAARFNGADVHVHRAVVLGRKPGQLEIMRGKQGEGLRLVVQIRRNAAGQCQPVESRGAAPDLVHQHQRMGRGGMQNLRGFEHFEHEGRLRIGHVVGRADAGVNRVDRPEPAAAGGHVGAHAGQQYDQRDLAHIG